MTTRTILLTLLSACLMLWSCDTKTKNVDSCGDGYVDPGEECDGTIGENTCASLGHYNQIGTLVCTSLCKFDTTDCGGRCGDDDVDGADGEECDGGNLNGQTCESQSYTGGTLSCGAGCTFDVSACAGRCGNGVIDADEGEICDGAALAGETCQTQGYHGGELVCAADCSGYNLDNCTAVGRCGDGVIQATYGEVCDGTELAQETCSSQGYYPGTLACDTDCLQLDLTDCEAEGRCGDGIIQEAYPEWCDGENLDGFSCADRGYSARGGNLTCTTGCMFDTGGCLPLGDNADLASLTVSAGTLSPAFSPDMTTYSVAVISGMGSLTVAGTAADAPFATVAITPSQPMALAEGENRLTISVTAEDGLEVKYYDVTVHRLSSQDYLSDHLGAILYVPAGTYQRDETATNLSTVSSFRMSKYEITRAQWVDVTGWPDPSNTTYSSGENDPVQRVNWYDAIAFCNKLSLLEGLTPVYTVSGVDFTTLSYDQIPTTRSDAWNAVTADWNANGYRLPTETEWMWAAMGADTAAPGMTNTTGYLKTFAGSTGTNFIGDYAVFGYNHTETGRTTTGRSNPVGSKLHNELGFQDLSGNATEWVWDWYAPYLPGPLTDYRGPSSGTERAKRGGDWLNASSSCTVAIRSINVAYERYYSKSFRVVRR